MAGAAADLRRDASSATKAANAQLAASLPFEDRRDFDDAARGLIAPLPNGGVIAGADGERVWDLSRFAFIEQGADAPETVNPSLWRQSQLVVQGGLYEVVRIGRRRWWWRSCTRTATSTTTVASAGSSTRPT